MFAVVNQIIDFEAFVFRTANPRFAIIKIQVKEVNYDILLDAFGGKYMIKKLSLSIFMLTVALLASASAQTVASTEKQAAIKELVSLVNGDNKAEGIINIMTAQMQESEDANIKSVLNEQTNLTAAERKSIEDSLAADKKHSLKRFQDKLMQKLNCSELINEIALVVYDKYYTLEEIRDLNAFYKTPTGQKTLKMMTPIMSDTMQMLQERLLPKIPVIIKELEDEDRQEIEQKINARKPKPKTGADK
jgi:hypothetical protein